MSKSENRNYSVTMFSPMDAFFQNGVKADVLFLCIVLYWIIPQFPDRQLNILLKRENDMWSNSLTDTNKASKSQSTYLSSWPASLFSADPWNFIPVPGLWVKFSHHMPLPIHMNDQNGSSFIIWHLSKVKLPEAPLFLFWKCSSWSLSLKVKVAQSCMTLCYPIQSMEFSRAEDWSG